jgi:hypothetical protein
MPKWEEGQTKLPGPGQINRKTRSLASEAACLSVF